MTGRRNLQTNPRARYPVRGGLTRRAAPAVPPKPRTAGHPAPSSSAHTFARGATPPPTLSAPAGANK